MCSASLESGETALTKAICLPSGVQLIGEAVLGNADHGGPRIGVDGREEAFDTSHALLELRVLAPALERFRCGEIERDNVIGACLRKHSRRRGEQEA